MIYGLDFRDACKDATEGVELRPGGAEESGMMAGPEAASTIRGPVGAGEGGGCGASGFPGGGWETAAPVSAAFGAFRTAGITGGAGGGKTSFSSAALNSRALPDFVLVSTGLAMPGSAALAASGGVDDAGRVWPSADVAMSTKIPPVMSSGFMAP